MTKAIDATVDKKVEEAIEKAKIPDIVNEAVRDAINNPSSPPQLRDQISNQLSRLSVEIPEDLKIKLDQLFDTTKLRRIITYLDLVRNRTDTTPNAVIDELNNILQQQT